MMTLFLFAVGATSFSNNTLYGPEEAASYNFPSGGGFSWNMERLPNATYQDNSVQNYFATASRLPPAQVSQYLLLLTFVLITLTQFLCSHYIQHLFVLSLLPLIYKQYT
jgi:hypothetical protein